jgi:NodT family efflux transporter outer membrane factor (OMF) lipoprotein
VQKAIQNNLDLFQAIQRIEQVRAFYNIQTSNLFPTIDFNGSYTRYETSQNLNDSPFLGPRIQSLFQLGFDMNWEIDFFGRLRNLNDAAKAEFFASKEDYRGVYITVIADVCRNYTLFRSFEKQIENLQQQQTVLEQILVLSADTAKAGVTSYDPYFSAKARLQALESRIPLLVSQMQIAKNRISILIGEQPERFDITQKGDIPQASGKIPVGVPSQVLRRRPDIRRKERILAASTNLVAAAVANLFPNFTLFGNAGYEASRFFRWFRPESSYWAITPSVTQPLINFGRLQSEVRLKRAEHKQVFFDYENTVLKALEEVENTLVSYIKQQVRLQSLDFEYKDNFQKFLFSSDRFQAGIDTFQDTLQAKLVTLSNDETIIVAQQVLAENLIALYKSLGGDWECSATP